MNGWRQVVPRVTKDIQKTLIGTEDVTRKISEQDGDQVGGDKTSQSCVDFGFHRGWLTGSGSVSRASAGLAVNP